MADAWKVFDVARHGGQPERLRIRPAGSRFLFAVPREEQLEFFGDRDQQRAFVEASESLQALGGTPVEIDFEPFSEVAALLYDGPWLAERLAPLQSFLESHQADVMPVTRTLLAGGSRYRAVEYFNAAARLASLRAKCRRDFPAGRDPRGSHVPNIADADCGGRRFAGLGAALGLLHEFCQPAGLIGIGVARRLCSLGLAARHHADRAG